MNQLNPYQAPIENLEQLRKAKRLMKAEIRLQEAVLRQELKVLPGEAVKAGLGKLVPFNIGKGWAAPVTGLAVTAGTALAGSYLTKRATAKVGWSLAKKGAAVVAPVLLKWLFGKKKKGG